MGGEEGTLNSVMEVKETEGGWGTGRECESSGEQHDEGDADDVDAAGAPKSKKQGKPRPTQLGPAVMPAPPDVPASADGSGNDPPAASIAAAPAAAGGDSHGLSLARECDDCCAAQEEQSGSQGGERLSVLGEPHRGGGGRRPRHDDQQL